VANTRHVVVLYVMIGGAYRRRVITGHEPHARQLLMLLSRNVISIDCKLFEAVWLAARRVGQ